MESRELMMKIRQNIYYILIAVATFAALVFLPMLGSDLDGGLNLPKTQKAWIVFITMRTIVSFLNVFIYASFINQGKMNILDDKNYLKANELLRVIRKSTGYKPRSPLKFHLNEYGWKGAFVLAGSVVALFALEQAILKYDIKSLLLYGMTVSFAIFFGIFEMKKVEIYWTVEYLEYAQKEIEDLKFKEETDGKRYLAQSAGTNREE